MCERFKIFNYPASDDYINGITAVGRGCNGFVYAAPKIESKLKWNLLKID